MENCAFCRIVSSELDAYKVYEDESCLGFLDERPVFPGHTLLIPRKHYGTLAELPSSLVGTVFSAVSIIARSVETGLGADGAFIGINNKVSQRVPHLHVHIIPRHFKDGLRGFFWPRQKYADEAEATAIQEKLAAAARLIANHQIS
jgi:histidine triad (HIT) family protein